MSYHVTITDSDNNVVQLSEKQFFKGGTYAAEGTVNAELNITYNYRQFFAEVWDDGLWSLQQMDLDDIIPELETAIAEIGTTEPDDDYWKKTAGNAGHALWCLLQICLMVEETNDKKLSIS